MLRVWSILIFAFVVQGFCSALPLTYVVTARGVSANTFRAHDSHHARLSMDQNDADDDDSSDFDFGDDVKLADGPQLPTPPVFNARIGFVPYLPLYNQTHSEPEIQPPKV